MRFIKAKEAEVMGGRDELQRWIAGETKGQIDEMATRVNQYQDQVWILKINQNHERS